MHLPLILIFLLSHANAANNCKSLDDYEAALTAAKAGNPAKLHQLGKAEFQGLIDQRNRLIAERSKTPTVDIQKQIKAIEKQIDEMAYEAKNTMGLTRDEALQLAKKTDASPVQSSSGTAADKPTFTPDQIKEKIRE
jgi:hypothetical protein